MADSKMNTYAVGTSVELRAAITDPDTDLPLSPDGVVCIVRAPNGAIKPTLSGPVEEGPGAYRWVVVPDQSGVWGWRVEGSGLEPADGTGPVPAAEEGRFFVKKSFVL